MFYVFFVFSHTRFLHFTFSAHSCIYIYIYICVVVHTIKPNSGVPISSGGEGGGRQEDQWGWGDGCEELEPGARSPPQVGLWELKGVYGVMQVIGGCLRHGRR
jgi:hypothetical protein